MQEAFVPKSMHNMACAAAWLALAAIIVLSLVPPSARPVTFVPHRIEHAGVFFLDGLAFGIAYFGYQRLASIAAVALCAAIELAQIMVPGRHARLSDFVIDATAACIGIWAGATLIRMARRYIFRVARHYI